MYYDEINQADIIDLRNSSAKVQDYNRLIDREFNKLVAGTYRGTEGEGGITKSYGLSGANIFYDYATADGRVACYTEEVTNTGATLVGDVIYVSYYNGSTYTNSRGIITEVGVNYFVATLPELSLVLQNGATLRDNIKVFYYSKKSTRTKSNTLTHTDIIGSPANYPTVWKQSGVSGTPIIVAEDGTSLLPTGTTGSDGIATFKLSRKANATPLQVLKSTDSGATWTALTVTTHYTFSTTANMITFTAGNIPLTTDLIRVTYQTHTVMATATTNSAPIAIAKGIATNGAVHGHLVSSLIGKVPTASTAPYAQFGYDIYGYRIDATTLKFSTTSTEFPLHTAFTLAGGALSVATVKTFPYLTSSNGKAYVNIPFKEMKHNGTSYGDDGKFFMTDNVTTTTDNNALVILTGTKRIELPYFISTAE